MEDENKEVKRAKWEEPQVDEWQEAEEPELEETAAESVQEEPVRPVPPPRPQRTHPPMACHPVMGMCHPRKGGCYPQGYGGYAWKHQCSPRFLCYPRAYYQQSGWYPPFGYGYGCFPRR